MIYHILDLDDTPKVIDDKDQSTCQDITDVFDDEATLAMDPTLTFESDHIGSVCDEGEDAPELPVDSRHSTPAHSSRETSRDSTPLSKRRQKEIKSKPSPRKITSTTSLKNRELEMENLRNYQATIPSLDESFDMENKDIVSYERKESNTSGDNSFSQTSGYKSDDFLASNSFKATELTNETSSPTSSHKSNSSISPRDKRLEDPDRFKTYKITKKDLSATTTEDDTSTTVIEKQSVYQELKVETKEVVGQGIVLNTDLDFLEEEANLVVKAIKVGKESARSRSSSADLLKQNKSKVDTCERSRSASIEILDDNTLEDQQFDVGSCNSTLERKKLESTVISSPGMMHRGARISKPTETENMESQDDSAKGHGIRGKRKPLYSSPNKNLSRSAIPPFSSNNKPTLAPKPKNIPSGITSGSHVMDNTVSPRQRCNGSPPAHVRSPRATNLRQTNNHIRKGSPPSPKISPRSIGGASDRSYRSGSSSAGLTKSPIRTISPRSNSSNNIIRPNAPLVRQGTFTKEEGTSSVKNIPIVDIDIGETSSTTSTYSSNTNNSYTRMSSIPLAGPSKHISPGSQASNRRYTAPSRSPRSVGSQSSLEDVPRSGRQSNSSSGSSIKIHQTRTSALRERSASKQGHGGQNPVARNTSISSVSSVGSSRSSKSSLRPSNSTQGLKTVAEGGQSIIPTPTRRSPSSADIEFRRRFASDSSHSSIGKQKNLPLSVAPSSGSPGTKQQLNEGPKSEAAVHSSPSTPSKKGKKEVTSRIANLWKKVEDSKKKKDKDKTNDKRIWIAKGKVIPESERALLRPHTEQQKLIDNFQKNSKQREQAQKSPESQGQNQSISSNSSATNNTSKNGTKERSRSRLSMKLSKFSRSSSLLSRDKSRDKCKEQSPTTQTLKKQFDPSTAPLATFDASLTSTEEDKVNGNNVPEGSSGTGIAVPDTQLSQNLSQRNFYGDESGKVTWPNRDSQSNKTREDISDDLNNANTSGLPDLSHNTNPVQHQTPGMGMYGRPSVGIPASAIVQPFNYSPPIRQAFYEQNPPAKAITQGSLQMQQAFKMPAPPSGLPRKLSNSAVRRNDSYLGSMGRKEDALKAMKTTSSNAAIQRSRVSPNKNSKPAGESGSSMVTLV